MFLRQLSDDERAAFDTLAHRLVASDGGLARQEEELLSQIRFELGFSQERPVDDRDVDALAEVFAEARSRRIVLLELLGIAHVDHEFHAAEGELVRRLAKKFSVSETELLTLENWTLRMMSMVSEAGALLGNEE